MTDNAFHQLRLSRLYW